MPASPLPLITALARSGALDQAWALFEAGGYGDAAADPSTLAVKGRLLKDRGLRAETDKRRAFFRQSAEAYAAADALAPAPYLLINVATLAFLSGDHGRGALLAEDVLARLANGNDIAETPYWLEATRAEALLLKGDQARANLALGQAISHDPDGWKDHASTLRQLGLILAEAGQDKTWLDDHRPPRSLHFVGHLGVAEADEAELRADVDDLLSREKIGFGYGALAAGADIIIAEALIAAGAQLHAVLPVGRAAYFAQSVDAIGVRWRDRFSACIAAADTISEITSLTGEFEPLAIALGGDYAMGAAVLNARMLESKACQLIVADNGEGPFGSGLYSARDAERWQKRGHKQYVLRCPRNAEVRASANRGPERPVPTRQLAAILHVGFTGCEALTDPQWPLFGRAVLAPVFKAVREQSEKPGAHQGWGAELFCVFSDVTRAFEAAVAAQKAFVDIDHVALGFPASIALTIGGHYDIAHLSDAEPPLLFGNAAFIARDIHAFAHRGTFTVSETFANALAFQTDEAVTAEYVGDLPGKVERRLFAIKWH